jgi:hypothetical protein
MMDGLLVQQDPISDGETTSPVQRGTQHLYPLDSILFDLIDMSRPTGFAPQRAPTNLWDDKMTAVPSHSLV